MQKKYTKLLFIFAFGAIIDSVVISADGDRYLHLQQANSEQEVLYIMQPKVNHTETNIKISESVLETIVKTVISEIPGVARLAPRSTSPIHKVLNTPQSHRVVGRVEAEAAAIDVSVVLSYGCHMKEVCLEIQEKVKDAIQDMTGIAVGRVNVFVTDIVPAAAE